MKERHYQQYLARKRRKERGESLWNKWETAQLANAPVHECLVPENLFELGLGNLPFSRRLANGTIALAVFLLDVFCLGAKNALFQIIPPDVYNQRKKLWRGSEGLVPMAPACFRKLVEGGVAYARDLGFNPHPDYAEAERIFGNVVAAECPQEFVYGHDGKPLYVSGPNDTAEHVRTIIEQLQRRLGPGRFDYLMQSGQMPADLLDVDTRLV